MNHTNNKETIERLRDEMKNGESSLDTVGRVVFIIKGQHPKLAEQFNEAYEAHSETGDGLEQVLLDNVCDALSKSPEYVDPFVARHKEIDGLMDGISV